MLDTGSWGVLAEKQTRVEGINVRMKLYAAPGEWCWALVARMQGQF